MPIIPPETPGGKPPSRRPKREDFATAEEYAKAATDWISQQPEAAHDAGRPKISGAPKPPPPRRRFAPPPTTELGGGGFSPPRLIPAAPELNESATAYYPDQLKAAVAVAHIAADQQFRRGAQEARSEGNLNERTLAELRRQWFWILFLGFAAGARDIVVAGIREAAYFVSCWPDFRRAAATAAGIRWELQQVNAELQAAPEWEKFQEILLETLASGASAAPPDQPTIAAGGAARKRKGAGRHRNVEKAEDMVAVIKRIAGQDWRLNWRSHLATICADLDATGVSHPQKWPSWTDQLTAEADLVRKNIAHYLDVHQLTEP